MKTVNMPQKINRRRILTAALLLVGVLNELSSGLPHCDNEQYAVGEECCPMCHRGNRVIRHCTEFISTSCDPCPAGTYMDEPNGRDRCFVCEGCDAGSGLKQKEPCTTTLNTVCEPLEGFYCKESGRYGCSTAKRHSSCKKGQYIRQPGTALTDTVCIGCTDGTFSDGTFTSCKPHTICESMNLQLKTAGTTSSDAECEERSSNTAATVVPLVVLFILFLSVAGSLYYFRKKIPFLTKGKNSKATVSRKDHGSTPESEGFNVPS